jgi:hypothetical protein
VRNLFRRRRSIYDLEAAKPQKLDDLGALVSQFGLARVRDPKVINRAMAQFIAIRACMRKEFR